MDNERSPSCCRSMRALSCVPGCGVRVDWSLTVGSARKSSPCGVIRIRKREKVRPARQKWLIFGVLGLPGEFFRGLAKMGALLGELFRGLGRVERYRWFYLCVSGRRCAWIGR